jgi:hypothetical protein
VLVAPEVRQIQLVHQPAFLEQFQGSVHRNAIELWVSSLRETKQTVRIQVLTGLVNQVEQHLTLTRQAHAFVAQGLLNAFAGDQIQN